MSEPPRRTIAYLVGGALGAGLWLAASVPLQRGPLELVAYLGPSAALGLLAGWASFAFARRRFTWRAGFHAVLIGAVFLPPVVAAMVASVGPWSPERQLLLFIVMPWAALLVGLLAGLAARVAGRGADAAVPEDGER
jgi:hypothetical protein